VTRTKRSTDLDSITRRKPLAIGEHHQETLGRGRYLQYHKPVGGAGTWIVRGYDPKTRKITQARLGEADDFTPADGTRTLTYAQARAKAEKWALDRAAVPVKKDEFQPALRTVREVVANYIETARMERKKAATAEADRKALETSVLPELGDIPVAELTASLEFEEASEAVPEAPATVLGGWLKDDAQGPIRKAYTAAGLEPLTFHELRHTYASALINRGVPLVFVAQQLGHADTCMVEEHYGHLCETAKRDAIRTSAPRIFSPQAKTVETEPEPPSRSRKRR
jgi:hypothetical protein